MKNNLGQNIEILIDHKKMSQNQLAKKVGIHHNMISEYVKGTAQPTANVLIRLCEVLKCDPNTLLQTSVNDNLLSNLAKLDSLPKKKKDMVLSIIQEFNRYHRIQNNLQHLVDPEHLNTTEN